LEFNRVRIDLDKLGLKRDSSWNLEPLSDIHFGHRNFDHQAYMKAVKRIANNANRSTFFNGDIIDCIPHDDWRFDWTVVDPLHPEETTQEDYFYELSEDIFKENDKTKVKCHGALMGNHEWRYYSQARFKKNFCNYVGIKFLGAMAFIWLDFYHKNKFLKSFNILTTHGSYGGSQQGGEVNQVLRFPARYDADIYLLGHSHQKWTTKQMTMGVVAGKGKSLEIVERTQIFGNLGTFLKTHQWGVDNYPEKKAIYSRLSKIGTITVEMVPETGEMYSHE